MIFDCRIRPDGSERWPHGSALDQFLNEALTELLDRPVALGTTRQRQHSGYPPQVGGTSGGYSSGFVTITPRVIAGRRSDGSSIPIAFIFNADTPDMRDIFSGLQAAGLASVVEETDGRLSVPVLQSGIFSMQLADGIVARIRNEEFVSATGELALRPTITVAPSPADDSALNAALKSLSDPQPVMSAHAPPGLRGERDRPYAEMSFPSAEYRLLALFRLWNVVHYFFPYRHLMDNDWSTALTEFIPRFVASRNALDYEMTVFAVAKKLQDTHVSVSNARAMDEHLGTFAPPISVASIEGQTVIIALRDEQAGRAAGLKVGDVILAVDDEPIEQRSARLEQLLAASTPQAMGARLHARLLRGPKDKPAKLRIKGADDTVRDVEVPRSAPGASVAFPPDRTTPAVHEILPSGFGYIDLARLTRDDADKTLDALVDTPALIFDMRGYPQGTAWVIGPRLLKGDKAVVGSHFQRNFWQGSMLDGDDWLAPDFAFIQLVSPSDKPRYKGKVVMLINEQAVSQAEHTCLHFSAATDVIFIGSPTNGANGDVTNFVLPGNLVVNFSGHNVRHADGRQLQRVGVQPHIHIEPTIAGIRQQRDEVLEAAVRYLQRKPN